MDTSKMSNFTNNISDCEGRSAENSTPAKFTQRSWTAQTDGRCPYIPEEDLHIVAFISEGSSGRVYRGTWSTGFQNGNSQTLAVALKWIRGETASSQCQRELDVLAIADHPNIVKFYGYSTGVNAGLPLFAESGTEHSGFFLVMELAPNGSLASLRGALKRLRDSDPVSHMKLTINFSLQIASGLQHLHFNKMLHLDLKPDNILCFNEK
ncbi:protein kinase, putative, partial [Bodo saltans]